MARTMDEVIRTIPRELSDASYSLGATKWETAMKVILRQAFPRHLNCHPAWLWQSYW
jgi:ABC-type phosphate transport system permease subunit